MKKKQPTKAETSQTRQADSLIQSSCWLTSADKLLMSAFILSLGAVGLEEDRKESTERRKGGKGNVVEEGEQTRKP